MSDRTGDSGAPVLRVRAMSFAYPSRNVFLHWSHDFRAGLTWLRGGNGAGKSTCLKLLAGALLPRSGAIQIQSAELMRDPLEYRRRAFWCGPGVIPFDHLSPAEYFGFVRHLYPTFDEAILLRHLAAFTLNPFVHAPLSKLSSGTQRKVWIAAGLAVNTPLLLLDEPLNGLDVGSSSYLAATLEELTAKRERVCVIVNHEDFGRAADAAMTLDIRASEA